MMGKYFPMFIDMEGRQVQVFGGGRIAARRVSVLLEFGAKVRVVAPKISEKLEELAWKKKNLVLEYRSYQSGELQEAEIVIAATNDATVNDMIFRECRHKSIPVNVASEKEKCDFYFPGIVKEGDLIVGITASGENHRMAAEVTERIGRLIKEDQAVYF